MLKIGFSLRLSKEEHLSINLIDQMLNYGCRAIEVDVSNIKFGRLKDLHILLKNFTFLSIHATENVQNSVEFYEKLEPAIVTVHPNYLSEYEKLSIPREKISVENMDWQQDYGRYPNELAKIFNNNPEYKFICDLNHVYTNDPTMKLVEGFDQFENISHYHVSGFKDSDLPHCPLYKTKQNVIAESLKYTSCPIIIESFDSDDISNFRKEFDYLKSIIEESKEGCNI